MEPRKLFHGFVFAFVVLLLVSSAARAADLFVDCDAGHKAKLKTITKALEQLPQGPNTIHIAGTCNESVTIDSVDRLTLLGSAGASIAVTDSSTAVVTIIGSNYVTVEGLAIDATAAAGGLLCADLSVCVFRDLTVEGGGVGIQYVRSSGFVLRNTLIEHSSGDGLALSDAKVTLSSDTTQFPVIRQNGGRGVSVNDGSTLTAIAVNIDSNNLDGIDAMSNSMLRISRTMLQNNGGSGINLQAASVGRIVNTTINNNAVNGVVIGDLSFARFDGTGTTITTGGALKVLCLQQFSATRGVSSVAGSEETNCTEPAP